MNRITTFAVALIVALSSNLLTVGNAEAQEQTQDSVSNLLTTAQTLEASGDYSNAFVAYKNYIQKANKSAAKRHAMLKIPVLQEAANYGAGPELPLYLEAMDLRAAGKAEEADALLVTLLETYAGSNQEDDALYLRAYIALMDLYDFKRASELLQTLRQNHPDSRYIDTALFADAIANEQMGNSDLAIQRMTELRDRHTGFSVAGISVARDEYLSRLWYERSNDRIEYLTERAENATKLISLQPHQADGYEWRAELWVDQRSITVLLNPSNAVAGITSDETSEIRAYSGIVENDYDSWVRLTIRDDAVRGMISVYGKQIKLQPVTSGGTLSDFHTLLLGDADGNTSEDLDEALTAPRNGFGNGLGLDPSLRTIKNATDTSWEQGTVSHVALVGVVIDSKYNDYHSGRGAETALSILNTTDGLFQDQLGIALKVQGSPIVITNRSSDPMNLGSVAMEDMMRNFRDYRLASSNLGTEIGLATLFSGNKNSDAALGLAWIGSACRTDGYDVSVVTPYKMPSLLSTHEIAHTMGAPHDSDTKCSNQSGHIMWPFLSSASGNTFSSCSVESMRSTMTTNNCHSVALDLSVTLSHIDANSLSIDILNGDLTRAAPDAKIAISGTGVGATSAPAGCTVLTPNEVVCSTGTLHSLESKQFQLEFYESISDTTQITVLAKEVGFIDVKREDNGFKTDTAGNVTPHVSLLSEDDFISTLTDNSWAQQTGGAAGAGGTTPALLTILALLLAGRRSNSRLPARPGLRLK